MLHISYQISVHLRGAGKKAPVAVAWQFNVLQNAVDFTAEIKRLSDTAPVTVYYSGICVVLVSIILLDIFFSKDTCQTVNEHCLTYVSHPPFLRFFSLSDTRCTL